jgi:hypothetical protein
MTLDTLREKVDTAIPFTLHVADGRSYEVPHRDFIWLPPRALAVMVAHPASSGSGEIVGTTIPLLMISGITEQRPLVSKDN